MPVFSANLNFLFNEVSFMEKFSAAAQAGFKNVEFMFPYDYDQNEIKKQLEQNGLKLVLFNLPAGNWAEGDRGIAADPARKDEFRSGVEKAIEAAKLFGVSRVNCLVGKVSGEWDKDLIMENLLDNIGYAADEFQKVGLDLMVEPINRFDIPGFYLNTTDQVVEIIRKLNKQNIYLQYDIYHAEREGEDHEMILKQYFDYIGHIQVADNPGRNEPGTGVIKIKLLFDTIDEMGFKGYIGMEYKPSAATLDSLGWVEDMGYSL
ncbi:MAG: Hydroxypyruvate isomerase [Candidatus Dichloromethanomonas elyunquensis]|nr:MAG: Hydroxypyruvate isomerase [Candidatus Dichloromethanomonas elyunquensis]